MPSSQPGFGSTDALERAVLAGIPLTAHVALAVDVSARAVGFASSTGPPPLVGIVPVITYFVQIASIKLPAASLSPYGTAFAAGAASPDGAWRSDERRLEEVRQAGTGAARTRLRAPACTYGLMRLHAVAHRCCWKLIGGHDQQHGAARWVGCAHAGNVAHGPRQSATGGTGRCERQRSTLQRPELPPVSAAAARLDGTAGAWCCARAQGPGAAEPRWNASSSCPAVSATEGCVELRRCRAELTFAVAAAATVGLRMCQGCGPVAFRFTSCLTVRFTVAS
jgi:hypothetical protein